MSFITINDITNQITRITRGLSELNPSDPNFAQQQREFLEQLNFLQIRRDALTSFQNSQTEGPQNGIAGNGDAVVQSLYSRLVSIASNAFSGAFSFSTPGSSPSSSPASNSDASKIKCSANDAANYEQAAGASGEVASEAESLGAIFDGATDVAVVALDLSGQFHSMAADSNTEQVADNKWEKASRGVAQPAK